VFERSAIAVGDRVTLSALGRERNPRVLWQAGTVFFLVHTSLHKFLAVKPNASTVVRS